MGGFFTVAALAVASRHANSVGAVRLTCTWEGLEVELVRGGRYAAGFAPAALAESVRFTAPYTSIRAMTRDGRALCLAFDPAVVTPHNRFVLTHFRSDPERAAAQAHGARRAATAAAYALPLPIGVLVASIIPPELVSGKLGVLSVAAVAAAAAWLVLREIARLVSWGGPTSDHFRDAFETELSRRLGLAPAPLAVGSPFVAPTLEQVANAMPRSRASWGIAGAVALAIGAIAFVEHYGGPTEPPQTFTAMESGSLARAAAPGAAFAEHERADYQRCICMRADSPLWDDGVPALSILLSSRREGVEVVRPNVDARGVPRYDFDLAVVNNASQPQHDVRIVVTFVRHKEDREVGLKERGLFWEGELMAGKSVKWRVRAPGDTMRIVSSVPDMLAGADGVRPGDPALDPAPADAFVALASAKRRVVRVHAAMMLAYLRDPRATQAVEVLRSSGGGGSVENETLVKIARATKPIIACDVHAEGGELQACVFNGSASVVRGFELHELPPDDGAGAASGRSWPASATVPIHEGVRLRWKLDGGKPTELEVRANDAR